MFSVRDLFRLHSSSPATLSEIPWYECLKHIYRSQLKRCLRPWFSLTRSFVPTVSRLLSTQDWKERKAVAQHFSSKAVSGLTRSLRGGPFGYREMSTSLSYRRTLDARSKLNQINTFYMWFSLQTPNIDSSFALSHIYLAYQCLSPLCAALEAIEPL